MRRLASLLLVGDICLLVETEEIAMSLWSGIASVVIALILAFVGRPNRAGEHPWFLRFDAALVLYPPIVFVFFALGFATVLSSWLTT